MCIVKPKSSVSAPAISATEKLTPTLIAGPFWNVCPCHAAYEKLYSCNICSNGNILCVWLNDFNIYTSSHLNIS